jgi:hypothetical protein
MDASLETLVIAAYVFAMTVRIPRPGPVGNVSDEEIVALAVAQAICGTASDRRFLGTIGRLLPGFFPDLPDQTQYNRRLRRLTPWITTVQLMVAELVAEGQIRLADGTLIACANYPGCASRSEFAGHASYGYCPSKSQFVWGMRLVLLADRKGVPVGYDLVGPKTGQERDTVLELAAAHPHTLLFADGGFGGREYTSCMQLIDINLITPASWSRCSSMRRSSLSDRMARRRASRSRGGSPRTANGSCWLCRWGCGSRSRTGRRSAAT